MVSVSSEKWIKIDLNEIKSRLDKLELKWIKMKWIDYVLEIITIIALHLHLALKYKEEHTITIRSFVL